MRLDVFWCFLMHFDVFWCIVTCFDLFWFMSWRALKKMFNNMNSGRKEEIQVPKLWEILCRQKLTKQTYKKYLYYEYPKFWLGICESDVFWCSLMSFDAFWYIDTVWLFMIYVMLGCTNSYQKKSIQVPKLLEILCRQKWTKKTHQEYLVYEYSRSD